MALQAVPLTFPHATRAALSEHLQMLCNKGQLNDALDIIEVMLCHGLPLSKGNLYCLIQSCNRKKDLASARRLRSYTIDSEFQSDTFLGSHLIHMFSSCGSLSEAAAIFGRLPEPSVFSWSAIISANVKHGQHDGAIVLYQKMQQSAMKPDGHVFVATLKACANLPAFTTGQLVHAHVLDRFLEIDTVIANALIDMYSRCGALDDAFSVFSRLEKRDVITWNSLIAGFVQQRHRKQASELVEHMLGSGLEPNIITWNTILAGYAQSGHTEEALTIFGNMQQRTNWKPDLFTFASVLKACASKGALYEGKWIHTQLIESGIDLDVQVSNAIVDMYIKCGRMEDAYKEVHNLPARDVVTWTAMISGYAQLGHVNNAMQILLEMHQEGRKPDHFTFSSLVKACTNATALNQGKLIHSYILESGFELDLYIRSALIDMYAKCASFECAYKLFGNLLKRDVVSWSALIGGLAMHGQYKSALQCVDYMLQDGLQPNAVILLCLLSACSHLGIADEGEGLFLSMTNAHGIEPRVEHYNLVVDLLGRVGHMNKAEEILQSMPLQCNAEGWISLLNSCRLYNNVQLGRECFERLIASNEQDASIYILMSSIYTDANMWDDADKVQEMRNRVGVQKEAGLACVEVRNRVHDFCVGDESHPQKDYIYSKLKSLQFYFREDGLVPMFG